MKILALDTATEACSAALYNDGELTRRYEHVPQQQANLILPMIDSLMADSQLSPAQLDAVAFGRGPGSFTGLRIAAGVTQGIACAIDIPVIPVSTLATLAQGVYKQHQHSKILAIIDARMNEVYCGAYVVGKESIVELVGQEQVLSANDVPQPEGGGWYSAGSGWRAFPDELALRLAEQIIEHDAQAWPAAENMLDLAKQAYTNKQLLPAEQAIPLYLRDQVAHKKRTN